MSSFTARNWVTVTSSASSGVLELPDVPSASAIVGHVPEAPPTDAFHDGDAIGSAATPESIRTTDVPSVTPVTYNRDHRGSKRKHGVSTATAAGTGGGALGASKRNQRVLRAAGGEIWEDSTMNDWDTEDFRLFCGDLGNDVNDDALYKAFMKYPSLQKTRVVRDKFNSKSKGYGFVSFKDYADYERAFREMNGKYIGCRPCKLSKSTWKDRNVDKKSLQKLKKYRTVGRVQ